MRLKFQKVHHLIRYFLLIGGLTFTGYLSGWHDEIFLVFIGPPLYVAYGLNDLVNNVLHLPSTYAITKIVFLAPISLRYYGLLGYQLKQLWNEHGIIRTVSLFALIAFILYIHHWAWHNLMGYFTPVG